MEGVTVQYLSLSSSFELFPLKGWTVLSQGIGQHMPVIGELPSISVGFKSGSMFSPSIAQPSGPNHYRVTTTVPTCTKASKKQDC